MLGKVWTISKCFPTHITRVGFLACMQSQMFLECPLLCESSCTEMTLEGTFSFMSSSVTLPCVFVQKWLPTKLTFPWSLSSMPLHMQFELSQQTLLSHIPLTPQHRTQNCKKNLNIYYFISLSAAGKSTNNQQYLLFSWDMVAIITPYRSYDFMAISNTNHETKRYLFKIWHPLSTVAEDPCLLYSCN